MRKYSKIIQVREIYETEAKIHQKLNCCVDLASSQHFLPLLRGFKIIELNLSKNVAFVNPVTLKTFLYNFLCKKAVLLTNQETKPMTNCNTKTNRQSKTDLRITQKQHPAVEVNPVTNPSYGRKNPLKCRKCGCTVSKFNPKPGSLQGALCCIRCGNHLKWLTKAAFSSLVHEGRMVPAHFTPGCPECEKIREQLISQSTPILSTAISS